ncbi:MAG: hypothetical protein ACI4P0_04870 [Mailhella sp.]
MSEPVARTNDVFIGTCSAHKGNPTVAGVIITGEFPTVEGENMAVTGCVGLGECSHTCTVIGCSKVVTINGIPIARVGDPVVGTITGVIVTGADFFTSD